MEWKKATEERSYTYKIPERWLYIHYYEALNTLFRFENSLRVFVYAILKNEIQEKWLQLSISSDDDEKGTIDSIAKRRKTQASKFGYVGYHINCPIMHLTSGELIGIITSDTYWKYFSKFFPGSKEIIKNKLEEIGVIRNALAHFRPLKEDDVEVVKQNVKQTMMIIETYLSQMLNCNNNIPTNTEDGWYKSLSKIENEECRVPLRQSKDGEWIKISILYSSPIVNVNYSTDEYGLYSILKLVSPAIIKKYHELAKFVTYSFETVIERPKLPPEMPSIIKTVSLVIHKRLVEKNHEIIRGEIESILQKIAYETELIKNDNLAKGSIIEPVNISLFVHTVGGTNVPLLSVENIKCEVDDDDPVEYWCNLDSWGEIKDIQDDFIAAVTQYPWMPVAISHKESDIPF